MASQQVPSVYLSPKSYSMVFTHNMPMFVYIRVTTIDVTWKKKPSKQVVWVCRNWTVKQCQFLHILFLVHRITCCHTHIISEL